MKPIFSICLLFITISALYGQDISIKTLGDNSPAVITEKLSISYGFKRGIILELLEIYEEQGLDSISRHQKVEDLYRKYQYLSEGKSELTSSDKKELGVLGQEEIVEALEFDIFLSTKGGNSPAVVAIGGQVEIWYGIAPEAFKGIWHVLEEKQSNAENFEELLLAQIKKFETIGKELEVRAQYDKVAKEAKDLLDIGDISGAERVLVNDLSALNKSTAYRNYEAAMIRELNLKYDDSTSLFFQNAVQLDQQNSQYAYKYSAFLIESGKFESAIKFLERSIELLAVPNSLNRVEYIRRYNSLGLAYYNLSEFSSALENYEKALRQALEIDNGVNSWLSRIYNNLGLVYFSLGSYKLALRYYEEALKVDLEIKGSQHSDISRDYTNIGGVYMELQDYESAEFYFRAAFEIDKWYYSPEHPIIATDYNNIGILLFYQGRCEEAKTFLEGAAEIDLKVYGRNHLSLSRDYQNLGVTYYCLKDFDTGIYYLQESLKINEMILGEYHSSVSGRCINISIYLIEKENYEMALNFVNKALKIDEFLFENGHYFVCRDYYNLGLLHLLLEDYCEALNNILTSVEISITIDDKRIFYTEDLVKIIQSCLDGCSTLFHHENPNTTISNIEKDVMAVFLKVEEYLSKKDLENLDVWWDIQWVKSQEK